MPAPVTAVRGLGGPIARAVALGLAIASTAAHGVMAVERDVHGLAMLALAAVCAGCGFAVWQRGTRREWLAMGALSAAMISAHVLLVAGEPRGGTMAMSFGEHLRTHLAGRGFDAMHVALLLAVAELLCCMTVLARPDVPARRPVGQRVRTRRSRA